MKTEDRRKQLLELLSDAQEPVKASDLAKRFGVSRQIIVGDIAILRAGGEDITPTPHGYMMENSAAKGGNTTVLACRHSYEDTVDELYRIVDNGGKVIDVTVEHPVYGELRGLLNVESRYDADVFAEKLRENNAQTLSSITGGIHLHTISYRDDESLKRIKQSLDEGGYLLSGSDAN
jgi:transcriptional regulator of NAD metabolism